MYKPLHEEKRFQAVDMEATDANRRTLLTNIRITEIGLARLVNDLNKKPVSTLNIRLLSNALDGLYSESSELSAALGKNLVFAGYPDLAEKATKGLYEHSAHACKGLNEQTSWGSLDDHQLDDLYPSESCCTIS